VIGALARSFDPGAHRADAGIVREHIDGTSGPEQRRDVRFVREFKHERHHRQCPSPLDRASWRSRSSPLPENARRLPCESRPAWCPDGDPDFIASGGSFAFTRMNKPLMLSLLPERIFIPASEGRATRFKRLIDRLAPWPET
jgi:hypothetical protein